MSILIVSEEVDISTDHICQWLNYQNKSFVRINENSNIGILDTIKLYQDKDAEILIEVENEVFNLNTFNAIFFRRGYVKILNLSKKNAVHSSRYIHTTVDHNIVDQNNTMRIFLYTNLKRIKSINNPLEYNVNKLLVLQAAVAVGFSIPETLITKNAAELRKFMNLHKMIITKPIYEQLLMCFKESFTGQQTKKVFKKDTHSGFSYSLFQKAIPKKIELRIFFFVNKCFSAAIFSQQNIKTKTDSRVHGFHNRDAPIRVVPYKLPVEIDFKIKKLMKLLKMESGSIDLIKTPKNEYVFLEVNPVGQFDYVSKLCNFSIEKHIATYFKDE